MITDKELREIKVRYLTCVGIMSMGPGVNIEPEESALLYEDFPRLLDEIEQLRNAVNQLADAF